MKNKWLRCALAIMTTVAVATTYVQINSNEGVIFSEASGPAQGRYISDGRFVTVTNNKGAVWQNFNWKKKSGTNVLYGKTYQVRGRYNHKNRQTYYSLYDNRGAWKGYLNSRDGKIVPKHGQWQRENKYVQVKNKNGSVWQNFNWKKKSNVKSHANKIYKAQGSYSNFNGTRYLSLFNENGTWIGYFHPSDVTNYGGQGPFISQNKYMEVNKTNGAIWQNFNWKKKSGTNVLKDKKIHVKGMYKHTNGQTYYSGYSTTGTWYGYINSNDLKTWVEKPKPKPTPKPAPKPTTSAASKEENISKLLYNKLNNFKVKNTGKGFVKNNKIEKAAKVRANEISTHYDHTRPNGSEPYTAMYKEGISEYGSFAENIARFKTDNSSVTDEYVAEKLFQAWITSEGHCMNILDSDFTDTGVQVNVKVINGLHVFSGVQMFYGQ